MSHIVFNMFEIFFCSIFETMPHSPDSHPFINRCHRKREKNSSTNQEKVSKIIAFPKRVRLPTTKNGLIFIVRLLFFGFEYPNKKKKTEDSKYQWKKITERYRGASFDYYTVHTHTHPHRITKKKPKKAKKKKLSPNHLVGPPFHSVRSSMNDSHDGCKCLYLCTVYKRYIF